MVGKGGGNEGERIGVVGATKYEKTTIPVLFINETLKCNGKFFLQAQFRILWSL